MLNAAPNFRKFRKPGAIQNGVPSTFRGPPILIPTISTQFSYDFLVAGT